MGTTLNTTNATAMTAMFKASLIIALVAFATFAPALAKSYTKELDGVRVEDGCAGCLATVWPTVALCFADLVALPAVMTCISAALASRTRSTKNANVTLTILALIIVIGSEHMEI